MVRELLLDDGVNRPARFERLRPFRRAAGVGEIQIVPRDAAWAVDRLPLVPQHNLAQRDGDPKVEDQPSRLRFGVTPQDVACLVRSAPVRIVVAGVAIDGVRGASLVVVGG